MAFYIRSEQVDQLARELAQATGEGLTEAVGTAIKERLGRVKPPGLSPSEQERQDTAEQILRQARASCLAYGATMPTKQEIEEMLGLDGY